MVIICQFPYLTYRSMPPWWHSTSPTNIERNRILASDSDGTEYCKTMPVHRETKGMCTNVMQISDHIPTFEDPGRRLGSEMAPNSWMSHRNRRCVTKWLHKILHSISLWMQHQRPASVRSFLLPQLFHWNQIFKMHSFNWIFSNLKDRIFRAVILFILVWLWIKCVRFGFWFFWCSFW